MDYFKKISKEKIAQRLDPFPRLRYTLGMSNDPTDPAAEIVRLRERVRDLERRHLDASFLLADWDGYYNPNTKCGNVEELASLIEDAYRILQNKSWRDIEPDSVEENTNG